MSTIEGRAVQRASARTAASAGALAAGIAVVVNLVVLLLARVAGADMIAEPPGQSAMPIGVIQVVAITIGASVVGVVLLLVLRSRAPRAWNVVAIVGLAFGVLSAPAPLTVEATPGTQAALALMHVVAGISWYVVVRRAARQVEEGGPGGDA